MTEILLITATVVVLIGLNGLYVASEFATVAARRTRINQMAAQGNRFARMVLPIVTDRKMLDHYVAACQIGITISSLVLGAYGQGAIAARLIPPLITLLHQAEAWGWNITTAVANTVAQSIAVTGVLIGLTMLQVIMGELFPKSVAIQYPEKMALGVALPMKWSLALFRPLIWFFNGSGNLLLRLMGRRSPEKRAWLYSPEEIELLVSESHEGGELDDRERQMLRNAFRLRDLTARQVMLHRTKIMAAPAESSVTEVMNLAIQAGFSRIPIYRELIDDIIGFVHVKDLFRLYVAGESQLHSVIRDAVYVPETLPVADVWQKLNVRRKYVAIVFDEYGGTAGLITFEDLIEEIFGELQDEFDDEMALIARDKEGRIYLRGDLLVADVNEYLELQLPTEAADTLGGLVLSERGQLPSVGDEVSIGDTVVRVEAMSDLGVAEVSLQLPPSENGFLFSEWEVAEHE